MLGGVSPGGVQEDVCSGGLCSERCVLGMCVQGSGVSGGCLSRDVCVWGVVSRGCIQGGFVSGGVHPLQTQRHTPSGPRVRLTPANTMLDRCKNFVCRW